ncbi:MAG: hypothetical protein GXP27_15450 [Planctomycetes bacterium]|nr:hypothetical protein [Planctomycetota bacterium]
MLQTFSERTERIVIVLAHDWYPIITTTPDGNGLFLPIPPLRRYSILSERRYAAAIQPVAATPDCAVLFMNLYPDYRGPGVSKVGFLGDYVPWGKGFAAVCESILSRFELAGVISWGSPVWQALRRLLDPSLGSIGIMEIVEKLQASSGHLELPFGRQTVRYWPFAHPSFASNFRKEAHWRAYQEACTALKSTRILRQRVSEKTEQTTHTGVDSPDSPASLTQHNGNAHALYRPSHKAKPCRWTVQSGDTRADLATNSRGDWPILNQRDRLEFAKSLGSDIVGDVSGAFPEYNVKFIPASQQPLDWYQVPNSHRSEGLFRRWHAFFAFVLSIKSLPVTINKIPNISVWFYPDGECAIAVDAETKSAQEVIIRSIESNRADFDKAIANNNRLWFKSFLKFEHQPKHFHFIPVEALPPGTFNGETVLTSYHRHKDRFPSERDRWIEFIATAREGELSDWFRKRSRTLNLAMIFAEIWAPDSPIWKDIYGRQKESFVEAIVCLKPMVDFFLK